MNMSMLEKDLQEIDLDEVEEALDDADDDATAERLKKRWAVKTVNRLKAWMRHRSTLTKLAFLRC